MVTCGHRDLDLVDSHEAHRGLEVNRRKDDPRPTDWEGYFIIVLLYLSIAIAIYSIFRGMT